MDDHSWGKRSFAKAEANFARITRARKDELVETKDSLCLVTAKNRFYEEEIDELTKRIKALEAAGKEIGDFVNMAGHTIVQRVENVKPRFDEISSKAIEFSASLALGAVKARYGYDCKDLRMIDAELEEAMIKNSDDMEAAAQQISLVANSRYPIIKACNK